MTHATLMKSAALLLMMTAGANAMAVVDLDDPSSYKKTVFDFTNWTGTSFTAFELGDKVGTAWETGNAKYWDVMNVTTPAELSGVLAFQGVAADATGKGYWYRGGAYGVQMRNATRSACVQGLSAGDVVVFNTSATVDFTGGGNGDGTWGEAVVDGNNKTVTMLTAGNLGFCPEKNSYIYSITLYKDAGALELPAQTSTVSLEQYGAANAGLATDAGAALDEVSFPEGGSKVYFHAIDNIYLEKNGAWLLRTGKGKSNFKAQNGAGDIVIAGVTKDSYVGITAGPDKAGRESFVSVTGGEFDRQLGDVFYYKATADGNMVIRANSGGVWIQTIKEYVLPYTATLAAEAADGAYYSTFSAPFNVTVPAGVTAYAATLDGTELTLTAVEGNVPANTGVILCAEEADSYQLAVAATAAAAPANDLLHTAAVTVVSDGSVYALANIPAEAGVAFYQVEADVVIPAHKAYLKPAAMGAPIRVVKGETAISNIAAERALAGQLFDLQGRQLQGRQGLFVADGKVGFIK